jgi:benzodiazapine receptor
MIRSVVGFLAFLAICLGTATVGSMLTRPSIGNWYAGLAKPAWTPPDWVFAPVWTTLYIMMAAAGWLIWKHYGWRGASRALTLFAVQLALNLGWSALFFWQQRPGAAFAEIVLLWLFILLTVFVFWTLLPASGWLMLPYLFWVSFAALLNFAIWRMNP